MPALFVWLVLLVAAAKMPLEEAALVAGTQQKLNNLLFFDIYGATDQKSEQSRVITNHRHLSKID